MSATREVTVAARVGVLDHPVGDLDRRRQVERRRRRHQPLLERPGDRERLEGRARLVGEPGRHVARAPRGSRRRGWRGRSRRPVGHRQDLGGARVHDDRRRAVGRVGLADAGEHALGLGLEAGVEGQLEVGAVGGGGDRVALELVAERVADHLRARRRCRAGARPRRPRARSGPGSRSRPCRSPGRRARPAGRSGGCRGASRSRAGRAARSARRRRGRPCARCRRSRLAVGEAAQDLVLVEAEDLARACARSPRRVLDLVRASRRPSPRPRRRRARGRVRSRIVPREPGHVDRLDLLALGLGAERAAAHPLDPDGADDDQPRKQSTNAANSSPTRRSIRLTARRPLRRRRRPASRRRGGRDRRRGAAVGSVGDGAGLGDRRRVGGRRRSRPGSSLPPCFDRRRDRRS